MVKINGVKATETSEIEKDVSPSINEILDRMENNFEARKVNYSKVNSNSIFDGANNSQKVSTLNNFSVSQNEDDSNIFLNILPMLLSKDKSINLKKNQNEIIKMLIKKTNNQMLLKLFELMPKLSKAKNTETENEKNKTEKVQNIDDFVKAEDFQSKEN